MTFLVEKIVKFKKLKAEARGKKRERSEGRPEK